MIEGESKVGFFSGFSEVLIFDFEVVDVDIVVGDEVR